MGYTPKFLRQQIKLLKADLKDKNAPFGVDLLIPQVGGGARATNYDYTHGQLYDLIDVMIAEKVALFVCAVGEYLSHPRNTLPTASWNLIHM